MWIERSFACCWIIKDSILYKPCSINTSFQWTYPLLITNFFQAFSASRYLQVYISADQVENAFSQFLNSCELLSWRNKIIIQSLATLCQFLCCLFWLIKLFEPNYVLKFLVLNGHVFCSKLISHEQNYNWPMSLIKEKVNSLLLLNYFIP